MTDRTPIEVVSGWVVKLNDLRVACGDMNKSKFTGQMRKLRDFGSLMSIENTSILMSMFNDSIEAEVDIRMSARLEKAELRRDREIKDLQSHATLLEQELTNLRKEVQTLREDVETLRKDNFDLADEARELRK